MDNNKITEGNKLICVFMGGYVYGDDFYVGEDSNPYPDEIKYHTSWDWLMPVVEKIAKHYDVSISSVGMWACYINRKDSDAHDSIADFGGFEPMIFNVWKAVVKFIEWHNRNPKTK